MQISGLVQELVRRVRKQMPVGAICESRRTNVGIEICAKWPMTEDPERLPELSTHVLLVIDESAASDFAKASVSEQDRALAQFDSFLSQKIRSLIAPDNATRNTRPLFEKWMVTSGTLLSVGEQESYESHRN